MAEPTLAWRATDADSLELELRQIAGVAVVDVRFGSDPLLVEIETDPQMGVDPTRIQQVAEDLARTHFPGELSILVSAPAAPAEEQGDRTRLVGTEMLPGGWIQLELARGAKVARVQSPPDIAALAGATLVAIRQLGHGGDLQVAAAHGLCAELGGGAVVALADRSGTLRHRGLASGPVVEAVVKATLTAFYDPVGL